ncbi:2,5-diketo-D-gluconic acid reductase [Campylobacter sp. MIT 12-8780]|uniref:aldo/keto reductase n=1 Tax=unclassified Campylobacter TaxID=2593542 RepID=UPI00115E2FDF|nr:MULTISPECIES: aldo/keto reductase [unclassified Campylobacter]NDJ27167.1 aldo/keto reductase [Campylobacter sp. MIT 19-121]TQR41537.1 2,5-diketo-D-gluconic acid reductase [Campylobacter sp. MIT 12-8780]
MKYITLNNGVKMPILGYGTFQITDLKEAQRCTEDALSVGYRSFDTAQAYSNEEALGAGFKASGVKREELFITTKLWVSHANEKDALKAFETSMKKLGLDYLDLYLIHQPVNDVYGAWRAMSKLYKEGRIKAIGVSNFLPDRLVDFCMNNEIKPAVNQIECNPFHQRVDFQKLMGEYSVAVESWASFGEGKQNMFKNPTLLKIAQKHNKSVAQVILNWLIGRGIIVIPKTTRKERMIENFNVFDFELDSDDKVQIAKLEKGESLFFNHADPAMVKYLNELFK